MPVVTLVHGLPDWKLQVLAWFVPVLVAVVGWLLAFAAVGRGPGQRVERSLFPLGYSAAALVLLLLGVRLVAWLDGWGPGPQHWLISWLPAGLVATPGTVVHPYDTLVAWSWLGSGVVFFVTPLAAILDAPKASRPPRLNAPLPGGLAATLVLAASALALPILFHLAYAADTARWVLLDAVGITPLLALTLGLRLQARIPAAPAPEQLPAPTPDLLPAPDIGAAWLEAGLAQEGAVLARTSEGTTTAEPTPRATSAWQAAAGPGRPPGSLDTLLDRGAEPGTTWLLGDLPAETEEVLLTAVMADAVGVRGLRVLAVVADPARHADLLSEALERARTWEPGHIAVGASALREALARQRLPAAVLCAADDLSERLVRLVGWEGRTWAAGLGLLLVHRPDRGSPIEVTHRAFTFKRWHLATGHLALPPVIATGADTPAVVSLLEGLFPGRVPRRCPLAPRSRGEVRVLRAQPDPGRTADPWVARAARAALTTTAGVVVMDPDGKWGSHPFHEEGVEVSREISYRGPASVADLEAPRLAEAFRAAAQGLPGPVHHSLWHVRPSPAARFLMVPGRLRALDERKELPVPRPVVGTRNRFLRTAHTLAALHEGRPDERSLRRTFGEDVVDYVLRECEHTGEHVARLEGGEVVRSPVVRPPSGRVWEDPHRATVTTRSIAVVDDRSGLVLAHVDERVAATRYYPKRVFALGTRRYRVPLHAIDTKRAQLRVEPADTMDRITRPLFRFDLQVRRVSVDRVTRREGDLVVSTLSVDALVREEVLAAWVPGGDLEERFDPVAAEYDSEVRLIFPERAQGGPGLFHLAASLDDLLSVHLRLDDEDAEVIGVAEGLVPGFGPGLAIIDRHVGGMGLARALDEGTVVALLKWTRALLYECGCMEGCALCTPERVLRAATAKQAVLGMLPGP